MKYHHFPIPLMFILLCFSWNHCSAVTTTSVSNAAAVKKASVCEGMSESESIGSESCIECHENMSETMNLNPHGQSSDPRSPFGRDGCETCHGPGMLHMEEEGGCIVSFTTTFNEARSETTQQNNDVCLGCHKDNKLTHWTSSAHEIEEMTCVSCHLIHKPDKVLERTTEAEVCYQCHQKIRSETFSTSSHPIRENKLICSDCHNSHGSFESSSLKQFSVNDNCYACHAEKRGPFLWEHVPVAEDCTLCHRVHGSNHQALLNKPGPQLCQQCHSARTHGAGKTHISNFIDFGTSDSGRSRFRFGSNCANCHNKVHGSNHPSGATLLR